MVYPEEDFQNTLLRPSLSPLKEDRETKELGLEGKGNWNTV